MKKNYYTKNGTFKTQRPTPNNVKYIKQEHKNWPIELYSTPPISRPLNITTGTNRSPTTTMGRKIQGFIKILIDSPCHQKMHSQSIILYTFQGLPIRICGFKGCYGINS
jgi:hypothetical protein